MDNVTSWRGVKLDDAMLWTTDLDGKR